MQLRFAKLNTDVAKVLTNVYYTMQDLENDFQLLYCSMETLVQPAE
jgi:hypothetical protein